MKKKVMCPIEIAFGKTIAKSFHKRNDKRKHSTFEDGIKDLQAAFNENAEPGWEPRGGPTCGGSCCHVHGKFLPD